MVSGGKSGPVDEGAELRTGDLGLGANREIRFTASVNIGEEAPGGVVKRQQDHREAARFAATGPPEEPACGPRWERAGSSAPCIWF